jgi:hypothetical protein
MRPTRAAIEPRGDRGSLQSVFELPLVALRRAQQDRHFVERHARSSLLEDEARDLDALATLTRRRKPHHLAGDVAFFRLRFGKEMIPEVSQV